MAKNTRRERFLYLVDRVLAKRWRFFVLLSVIGFLQILLGGAMYMMVAERGSEACLNCDSNMDLLQESLWMSWLFMADPGSQGVIGAVPLARLVGGLQSLGGILFFASVLGLTVDLIREKLEAIREGRSKIIEKDHTLILGWTEKTYHIVEEICKANSSEGGGVIAILAREPKIQMEMDLEMALPTKKRQGTRVVFRSGSPLVTGDLARVSVHHAKSIIILSSAENADQADSDTLRTMLSLRALGDEFKGHVVAEVRDIDNDALVKLVGGGMVETLVSHDVIGRLMLMSVRQPGLAKVYEALLGFDGDEFYMEEWPELVGVPFCELCARFPDAVPIGLYSCDGIVTLGPAQTRKVECGDKVIVIAEDNDTYRPQDPETEEPGPPPAASPKRQKKEQILFCGWRRDIRDILLQLDSLVAKGTEVYMMTHCVPIESRNEKLLEDGLDVNDLRNIILVHHFGNTSVRRKLEVLPVEKLSSCMIFADQAFENDALHADSHSLATLLLIRDIQTQRNWNAGLFKMPNLEERNTSLRAAPRIHKDDDFEKTMGGAGSNRNTPATSCPIICEVLDPQTQKTIAGNRHLSLTSDFCQTNKLVAQVLAMVSEERIVALILDELLGGSGCHVAVVPSSRYTSPGETISFLGVQKRAVSFGEFVVGYQEKQSIEQTMLNPPAKNRAQQWMNYDFAILTGSSTKSTTEGDVLRHSLQHREERSSAKDTARCSAEGGCSPRLAHPAAQQLELGNLFGAPDAKVSAVVTNFLAASKLLQDCAPGFNRSEQAVVQETLGSLRLNAVACSVVPMHFQGNSTWATVNNFEGRSMEAQMPPVAWEQRTGDDWTRNQKPTLQPSLPVDATGSRDEMPKALPKAALADVHMSSTKKIQQPDHGFQGIGVPEQLGLQPLAAVSMVAHSKLSNWEMSQGAEAI